MPTLAQIAPLIRILIPVLTSVLTQYVGASVAESIGSILLSLLGAGAWSLYRNTATGLTKSVAEMPGVKVAVSSDAAPELRKLASDPSVPDVVHADVLAQSQATGFYATQRSKS